MRRLLLLLRSLLSAARRWLSVSRAVFPLIRILIALKRFVHGYFGSLSKPSASTTFQPTQSFDTTPPQHVQSADHPEHSMPSSLPVGTEHDMTLLPRPVTPDTTLHNLPIPFAPAWFQRYKHRQPVEKRPNKEKIKAGQMSFSEQVPVRWERVVHPEGARYYFNANKSVFTDASITEHAELCDLEECIHHLRNRESQMHLGSGQWVYYFVNHDTHVVFWVEDFDLAELIPQNIVSVTEDSHIMYVMEEQYWWHCEQFPSSVSLLQRHVTEAWGIVAYAYIDSVTSLAPLCPLSQDELGKILGLMPYLQCDSLFECVKCTTLIQYYEARVCATDHHALWILARAMRILARARLFHFYGQPGARLEGDMSVYVQQEDHRDECPFLFHFLDFLLCFALASHVDELKSIWVDDIINYARWSKFSSNLIAGWNGFTIYSTVMLAVDVSLLAVPAVNQGNVNSQSVAVVVTYMSLLCVTGSLISSVLLARQISTLDTSSDAANFMLKMTHWNGGILILGITFSLPCALLIWAMFFFTLALLHIIFQTTDLASLSVMILGTVVVTSIISLPIWWGRNYACNRWFTILRGRFQQDRTEEHV